MKRTINHKLRLWILFFLLLAVAATGCSTQVAAETTTEDPGYTGTLDTSHENALDPISQLALGTLSIEGTADAVTAEQAAALLPLWQALQGNDLQGDAERYAAVELIETVMTEDQLLSIAGMQLTQQDALAWTQSQGNESTTVSAAGAQGGKQREGGASNMTEEQMAARQAQFGQRGGNAAAGEGGSSTRLLGNAVVAMLSERSGAAIAQVTTVPPVAAAPTATPTTTPTSEPDEVDPTPTPEPETATDGEPAPEPTVTPTPETGVTPEATPIAVVSSEPVAVPTATPVPASPLPALEQIEDTNPGPPFAVEVSANTAVQDPLVEASRIYKVTGVVRNDGDQTYAVSALHVTFYDADGFRGIFTPAIRDGKLVGGEWDWHAEPDAEFAALLLAPGEVWPFSIEITAQNMASFLIHADAVATGRESAPAALSDVRLIDEGTGYLRISGTATNSNSFKVKNVTVSGVLLDANGQMVSVGSVYVLQEDIAPGASVHFDVRIEKEAYTGYQLYAQAERDWE